MHSTSSGSSSSDDPRARLSREAVLGAFMLLVQQQPYSTLGIKHIIEKAGVARSTFYVHFSNKDALLLASMEGPFATFTYNALGQGSLQHNIRLLQHFWDRRSLARNILTPALQRKFIKGLAAKIEASLPETHNDSCRPALALQLATAQWMPMNAWLEGSYSCSTEALAAILVKTHQLLVPHLL